MMVVDRLSIEELILAMISMQLRERLEGRTSKGEFMQIIKSDSGFDAVLYPVLEAPQLVAGSNDPQELAEILVREHELAWEKI